MSCFPELSIKRQSSFNNEIVMNNFAGNIYNDALESFIYSNFSFNDTVQLSYNETQTGTTNGGALSLRCGNFTVNNSEFNNNYVVGAENTTVYGGTMYIFTSTMKT